MAELLAVLDTCVLYPAPLYNTLLYAAFHRVYQPLWTDLILAELRRTLLTDGRRAPEQVERRLAAMTSAFEPGANLDRLPNHPKDRHVLAAAVATEADFLVTANLRDFRLAGTPYQGLRVVSPDDFLVALLAASRWHQLNLLSALHAQVRDSRSLATLDALLDNLIRHNAAAKFAAATRRLQGELADWPDSLRAAILRGAPIPAAMIP